MVIPFVSSLCPPEANLHNDLHGPHPRVQLAAAGQLPDCRGRESSRRVLQGAAHSASSQSRHGWLVQAGPHQLRGTRGEPSCSVLLLCRQYRC